MDLRQRFILWSVVLVLVLTGCVAGGSEAPTPQPTNTSQPAPTATNLPPTATAAPGATATRVPSSPTPAPLCEADEVAAFVTDFVDAFNAGDQAQLDAMLPDENYPYAPAVLQPQTDQHQFRGFNLRSEVVSDRNALLDELVARQASGERWEIDDLVVEPELYPFFEMPQIAVFGLELMQLTGDGARYPVAGKGTVNCVDETLIFFWGGSDPSAVSAEESALIS